MISPDQIEEWIREVEERPSSASLIIRYITARLRELSGRNEELLAENISLRTEKKVEDYESRIANLEYQLDLLKRQLGGDVSLPIPLQTPAVETISFLVYNTKGKVLRVEAPVAELVSGNCIADFADYPPAGGLPRLLATVPTEELLFIFDSGRAEAVPVTNIPATRPEQIDWKNAYLMEPHGNEELVTILPAARMTLYDCCLQISRRGCAKKMMKTAFESHVSKGFVGTGVKAKPDRTCDLILCGKDDLLVLASREGYLWSLDVSQLPYTIEEVLKLSATDYLANGFVLNQANGQKAEQKQSVMIVTHNGKVIHREASWLEKPATYKSRGQAIFSQARRDAGVRVVGAASVMDHGWAAALYHGGGVSVHKVSDLLESGSLAGDQAVDLLEFVTFNVPGASKA